MAELIRTVNLTATFASLEIGEIVEIGLNEVTESNVRTAASRFAKENAMELKVSVSKDAGTITVTRKS
ncbi:hypothetical protein [uncultured Alistipes sp.]|jgi:hypothetical protein|uniref:hypothetical protein n=1 Tax=uncultured Alistipes sp. TaxID=538949 RepID=UPI0025D3F9AB|nr:hypothetical protein [uncultured Alistipes sp.]